MDQFYKIALLLILMVSPLHSFTAKALQHQGEGEKCHVHFSTEKLILKIPEPSLPSRLKKSKNEAAAPDSVSIVIQRLIIQYFCIKNALLSEKINDLQEQTGYFIQQIDQINVPVSAFLGKNILVSHLIRIRNSAKKISKSYSLHKSRINFSEISLLLIELVKIYQIKSLKLYHQYCPISLEKNKAHWMHNSPEIQNPFHGQKMVHCGVLIEELVPTW
jgi:Protein of unknown function (DUF3347)